MKSYLNGQQAFKIYTLFNSTRLQFCVVQRFSENGVNVRTAFFKAVPFLAKFYSISFTLVS